MIVDDKLMKYVVFKKRTEHEVRRKCATLNYTTDYIEEIIDYLKESEYINDKIYTQKYINNIIRIKNSSIYEMKIGLLRKGVDEDIIDEYINREYEELNNFELESLKNLINKKGTEDIEKLKRYLRSKGYISSNINYVIDNLE